ncbi:MAG: glycosyltransferase family 2 protein [Halolamina sp.]
MYRGHSTAVVIPAYNEAGFVGDTIASVPAFVDRVYAVDDGSTDETWDEIRDAADTVVGADGEDRATRLTGAGAGDLDSQVIAIQHERNRGVGGAIKTGYQRARADEIDLTAVMGGDGQMEPEMLGDLFDPIVDGDADYTKGNRFLGRQGRGAMPAHRFVGNAVLGALTKIASGYWAAGDPQSGYTAISLRALRLADVDAMYEFYGYCNDLLVKLNVARLRVVDVPRPITYGDEESHIRYRSYVPRVSLMLSRNFLWRLKTNYLAYDFHPLIGAYATGGLASMATIAAFVWALPAVGVAATPLARGAVALAFGLIAMLSITWAMAMDRDANAHLDDAVLPADRRRPDPDERAAALNGTASSVAAEPGAREDVIVGGRVDPTAPVQPSAEDAPGPNTASD